MPLDGAVNRQVAALESSVQLRSWLETIFARIWSACGEKTAHSCSPHFVVKNWLTGLPRITVHLVLGASCYLFLSDAIGSGPVGPWSMVITDAALAFLFC